jgi:hypothetical protein
MGKILLQFSWGRTQFSKYGDQRSELERELANLGARGCQTLLVFSDGNDPMGGALAREIFATHMGTVDMMRLPKGFTIETVEGADHSFVNRKARYQFRRLLTEFVIERRSKNPSLEAAE